MKLLPIHPLLKTAIILLCLAMMPAAVSWACGKSESPPAEGGQNLSFVKNTLEKGVFHYVVVPAEGPYSLTPAVSDNLELLEAFVEKNRPLAAINGGYFDPANGQTTSYITLDGSSWLRPEENIRLTGNPALGPYLERIFNRTEFRRYRCGERIRYDIAPHREAVPPGCILESAMGAGPRLFPDYTAQEEAFIDYDPAGKLIRDPLGVGASNARSAVGIMEDGSVILGMVAKHKDKSISGFTLKELGELMSSVGAVKVLALDGGSSSGLYFNQNFFYGKFTEKGLPVKRELKSVLMVVPDRQAAQQE